MTNKELCNLVSNNYNGLLTISLVVDYLNLEFDNYKFVSENQCRIIKDGIDSPGTENNEYEKIVEWVPGVHGSIWALKNSEYTLEDIQIVLELEKNLYPYKKQTEEKINYKYYYVYNILNKICGIIQLEENENFDLYKQGFYSDPYNKTKILDSNFTIRKPKNFDKLRVF